MPILGCGAELARVMEVADSDVQAIEDHLDRLTKAGVPQQEAQRLAVSRLIEDLQVSSRAARPQPVAGVATPEPATAPAAASAPVAAQAPASPPPGKPKLRDTRGTGVRLHGTSRPLPDGGPSNDEVYSGNVLNIYGQGFYTTDAADIAAGYTRKGKGGDPTVYEISEREPVRLYDMDAPMNAEVRAMAERALGDLARDEDAETGQPITTLSHLFDEARAESRSEGVSAAELQDSFYAVRENLEQMGYRGFTHVGGQKTGNAAHKVNIYWFPESDLNVARSDLAQFEEVAPAYRIEETRVGQRPTFDVLRADDPSDDAVSTSYSREEAQDWIKRNAGNVGQPASAPAADSVDPASPDIRYSRSAIKSVEANARRGEDAMNRALVEKADVNRAMYRTDLGWVDFVWGDDKRGLQHILRQRQDKDGMSESEVKRMLTQQLVPTIARGAEVRRREVNGAVNLWVEHDGHRAVLVRKPGSNGWLLTGFELVPDERRVGFDTASPTLPTPTVTRREEGAGPSEIVPPAPDLSIPRAEAEARIEGYKRAGLKRIKLVESADDLPEDGQRRIESEGIAGVRGMYSPTEDMIYLVRENLTSGNDANGEPMTAVANMLFTTLHEAFHRGLRKTIPSVGPVLDQIYLTNPSVRAEADRYAAEHGMGRQEATEEVLADMAGRGEARDLKGWDRLAKTIREWLDRIGRAVSVQMTWTDEMIQDLVAGARDAGLKADMQPEQGDARYSRGPRDGGDGGGRPAQRDLKYEPNPWNTPEPTNLDWMIYQLQDAKVDLKRVQQAIEATGEKIEEDFDARMAETLYAGRVAKRHQDFLNVEVKPLLEAMARNGVSMDELSDFLLARHAPERNAQIAKVNPDLQDGGAGTNSKGDLMTTAVAEQYIEDLSPARRTLLQMLARQVDGITKGTRDVLVQEGLESAETVAAWQGAYAHYVPLFRDEAQEGDAPAMNKRTSHSQGSGFSVRGTSSKRAVGSTKEVTNMLAHVLMQREAAMTRAEKNRVGMALYGLALSNPNPEFWTVIRPDMSNKQIQSELEHMGIDPLTVANMEAAPTVRTVNPATNTVETHTNPMYRTLANALTLKVGGEDRVIMFNEMDPRAARLALAMKNMDGVTQLDLAGSIVGKSTRWLASVNTQYNPAFGIVNATRDALGAAVNLGSTPLRGQGVRVLADTPRALAGIAAHLSGKKGGEWAKLYEQFQDDGAQTGFKELFRDAHERTKRIEKELKAAQRDGTLTPARAAHAALDLLDGFNTTMENGVRLAAYKAALDKGMSRPAAAKLARELTVDFNRKGRVGRELGPLYAFFNASIQGSARTLEALAGPTGKRILIGGLALGVLQSMMLAGAGYEEDEISEFIKTRNFIIPLGDKKWAAIPLPLGLHVLPNTGRVLTDLAIGDRKDASKKLGEAIGEILGAFNPLGGGNVMTLDGALKTAFPTVVDPFIELGFNKNFAGSAIEKRYDEQRDNRPGHTRARESTKRTLTGQAYVGISEAINTLTGGTAYEAGMASPSPEQVRYLTQTVGGGLLREIEKTINLATPSDNAREAGPNSIPLVSRFTGRIDDRQVQQGRYGRNVERAEKLESSMKAAENAGDAAAAREMAKRPDARIIQATNEVQSEIAKLNKLAVQTINSPEKLRRIDEARYQAQLRLNEAIRKLETERAK